MIAIIALLAGAGTALLVADDVPLPDTSGLPPWLQNALLAVVVLAYIEARSRK